MARERIVSGDEQPEDRLPGAGIGDMIGALDPAPRRPELHAAAGELLHGGGAHHPRAVHGLHRQRLIPRGMTRRPRGLLG